MGEYAILIDSHGFRVNLYNMKVNPPIISNEQRYIYDDLDKCLSMLNPKWNGTKWIETATPEEIEAAKLPVQPVTISDSERISALEEAILTLALGGALDV